MVTAAQARVRRQLARTAFLKGCRGVLAVQTFWRCVAARWRFGDVRHCTIVVQTWRRAHTARRAIFRGADGELCREDGDSALQTLVAALAPRRCVELGADDSGGERVVLLAFGSTAADLASMQRRG